MIGQHYLICGGTNGLGLELVHTLLKKGVTVSVIGRKFDVLERRIPQILKARLHTYKVDLMDHDAVSRFVSQLPKHTRFDGYIYAAGVGFFKRIDTHSTDEFMQTYRINILQFNALLEKLKPFFTSSLTVIGISSMASLATQPSAAHYSASKAALAMTLNALRMENPEYHVMTVYPGPIKTNFHAKADPSGDYAAKVERMMLDPKQLAEDIVKHAAKGRIELYRPLWMYMMLKLYQLAPRTIERLLKPIFMSKEK